MRKYLFPALFVVVCLTPFVLFSVNAWLASVRTAANGTSFEEPPATRSCEQCGGLMGLQLERGEVNRWFYECPACGATRY